MKFNNMKLTQHHFTQIIKPISLAIVLGASASYSLAAEMAAVIDPESAVINNAPEVYDNESWQAPAVIEFNKLDKSGNGLLLPNEASKGKAFNKKTFKQADTDNDGSIDLNEYVFFKTGKAPEAAKPKMAVEPTAAPATEAMPDKTEAKPEMPDAPVEAMPDENP
jgi:EF hand